MRRKNDAAVTTAAETVPEDRGDPSHADVPTRISTVGRFILLPRRCRRDPSVRMLPEAEDGDPLNDAVFRRNQTIEEKYNFTITL